MTANEIMRLSLAGIFGVTADNPKVDQAIDLFTSIPTVNRLPEWKPVENPEMKEPVGSTALPNFSRGQVREYVPVQGRNGKTRKPGRPTPFLRALFEENPGKVISQREIMAAIPKFWRPSVKQSLHNITRRNCGNECAFTPYEVPAERITDPELGTVYRSRF